MTLQDLAWFSLMIAVYVALNAIMYRYQLCWLYRLYGKEPPPIFGRSPAQNTSEHQENTK